MSKKLNLRDRVVDGELDLSMCDLQEVPIREIVGVKKATSLDLSSNHLTNLGKNFASQLVQLVKLDLSKNQISKLPDNFGDLAFLKHLDLYSNKLNHLPLSFGQLKNLKWLDLKNNPLVPALAEIAGPCQDQQQCQQCAKKVVKVIGDAKLRVEEEQRKLLQLQKEKEMAEKAAAKKEQQKSKKALRNEKKKNQENGVKNDAVSHENNVGQKKKEKSNKGSLKAPPKKASGSFLRSMFRFFFTLSLVGASVLYLLYLVDLDRFVQVREGADRAWNTTLALLPPEMVSKGRAGVELVRPTASLVLAKVGEVLNTTSTFLETDPRVKEHWANVKGMSEVFRERVVAMLRTVYHQVPVYYHEAKKKWFE